jgi:hypothetical protein
MYRPRTSNNFKRRIATGFSQTALDELARGVRYGGNPEHKRNPGDFGLTPPAAPRRDKSLCDEVGVFRRADALALLRDGIRRGLISDWSGDGFPKNVWSVTLEGIPLEAQLENSGNGTYHGYPLIDDDFGREVLIRWGRTNE